MHEAISRIWQSNDRSVEAIQNLIEETVAEYLDTSFLPTNEKEAVKKELFEDAPVVAKALDPHFNPLISGHSAKGAVFTERWVKTVFGPIPIHGKLDAIVESGDEVLVFDYKTRQAMSVNKIKGETKDSNGDYFRQLVFYKLLLAGEPRWKTRRIEPALVFVKPDDKGRCPTVALPITEEDIETVKKQIQSVIDSVWSSSIATARCADPACEWCGLIDIIG
jgi:ATP-dependent exoDNAse (exonuclease V) beta subunit